MSPLANHADRADLGAPGRIAPSRFRARESHASRPLGSTSIASGLVASGLVASGLARLAVLSFGGLACFGGLLFFVGGRALADPAYNHGSLTFEDPDHDGLPSALEFILGSDPTLYDTDGDGFDDGLETAVGTDPLIPDESIPDQSDLRIEFFPIPDNRVGILFLCHGRHGMDVIHRFRVLAGRGTVYASHTNELARRGVRLPSANPKIASIAMTTRLDAIGERLNVIAEFVEDGRLVSVTRAIGVHAGEIYIQDFVETEPGEMLGRYQFLGNRPYVLVPGLGANWGPQMGGDGDGGGAFLDDHVFTERIIRVRHKGLIIDTVIENRCDPDPEERCPTDLDTVGEVRTGPAR